MELWFLVTLTSKLHDTYAVNNLSKWYAHVYSSRFFRPLSNALKLLSTHITSAQSELAAITTAHTTAVIMIVLSSLSLFP